jgi:2-keto-4-pentenoate hydratase/2-oxohepta-3-ene-1,7-dioic acid hydratase in catechol pathway
MRLASIEDGRVAIVRDDLVLPLDSSFGSIRGLAIAGPQGLDRARAWADGQPAGAWLHLGDVAIGPAVPDPGAIYTIGLNYAPSGGGPDPDRPPRPLVYGKARTSVAEHGGTLMWDRTLTPNVDAECELGVVVGASGRDVFGYTVIDDISSRDEWLDGDQWLLGKSMPGFCPVGPWIVTADDLDPSDLRLGCTINGEPIQDGRTSQMRFSIGEIVTFLNRHVVLRPGDLIATGTPARLTVPPGPDRHLQPGDLVACWIEGIGELTTHVARPKEAQ